MARHAAYDVGKSAALAAGATSPAPVLGSSAYSSTEKTYLQFDGQKWSTYALMATAAPALILAPGSSALVGTSQRAAREDHAHVMPLASGSAGGAMSSGDFTKLAGIATGATNTPLSTSNTASGTTAIAAASNTGTGATAARVDHTHAHGTHSDGTMHALASGSAHGFMSSTDFTKLGTLGSGVSVSSGASDSGKVAKLDANGKLLIGFLPAATGSAAGTMSSADFTKLSGIATGATNTPLATSNTATGTSAIGVLSNTGTGSTAARIDHTHAHGTQTDQTMHALASGSAHGFLSSTDFSKLASLGIGVTVSAGAGDSGKVPRLDAAGLLSPTFLPAATGSAAGTLSAAHYTLLSAGATTTSAGAADANKLTKLSSNGYLHYSLLNGLVVGQNNPSSVARPAYENRPVLLDGYGQVHYTLLDWVEEPTSDTYGKSGMFVLTDANNQISANLLGNTLGFYPGGAGASYQPVNNASWAGHSNLRAIGSANLAGTQLTAAARVDHTHAHGAQTDGTMHAEVVARTTKGLVLPLSANKNTAVANTTLQVGRQLVDYGTNKTMTVTSITADATWSTSFLAEYDDKTFDMFAGQSSSPSWGPSGPPSNFGYGINFTGPVQARAVVSPGANGFIAPADLEAFKRTQARVDGAVKQSTIYDWSSGDPSSAQDKLVRLDWNGKIGVYLLPTNPNGMDVGGAKYLGPLVVMTDNDGYIDPTFLVELMHAQIDEYGAVSDRSSPPAIASIAASSAIGTRWDRAARWDHVHAHGAQTDPTMHALASGSAHGFMSSAHFNLIDGARETTPGYDINTQGSNSPHMGKLVKLNWTGKLDPYLLPTDPYAWDMGGRQGQDSMVVMSKSTGIIDPSWFPYLLQAKVTVYNNSQRDWSDITTPTLPPAIAATSSLGTVTNFQRAARFDHTHAHGAQTDPTMHALASGSAHGFMSSTHYTKLQNSVGTTAGAADAGKLVQLNGSGLIDSSMLSGVGSTPLAPSGTSAGTTAISTAGNTGTSSNAARQDHTHDHGTHSDPGDHALASGSAHGFMSSAHYTKVAGSVMSSAGAGDGGKLAHLDGTGRFDNSLLPGVVTSSGASDSGKVPFLNGSGQLAAGFLPAASGSAQGALAAADFTKLGTLGTGTVTSAGAGDTGKTVKLNANGRLDKSLFGDVYVTVQRTDTSNYASTDTSSDRVASSSIARRGMLTHWPAMGNGVDQQSPYVAQPAEFSTRSRSWQAAVPGSTTPLTFGFTQAASGSVGARSITYTNPGTGAVRIGYACSAVAGSSAGIRDSGAAHTTPQSNNTQAPAWFFHCRMVPVSISNAQHRFFFGMAPLGALANANPSTFANAIGIGCDSGDTLMYLICKGTKVSTGITFRTSFANQCVDFAIYQPRTSTNFYAAYRLVGMTVQENWVQLGSIAVNGTFTAAVAPQVWWNNGTAATTDCWDTQHIYLETEW